MIAGWMLGLCLASVLAADSAVDPSVEFSSRVIRALDVESVECPSTVACPTELATCARFDGTFSAFKADWEPVMRRYEIAPLAEAQGSWGSDGVPGSFQRRYDVDGVDLVVRFRSVARLIEFCPLGTAEKPASVDPVTISESPQRLRPSHLAGFGGVTRPRLIETSRVEPSPAPEVAPSGTDVESTVELILRADGTVSSARVTRCLPDHPGLREAVVAAVRQWRFEPARLDGVAVDVVYSTQVDFVVAVEGVDGVDD